MEDLLLLAKKSSIFSAVMTVLFIPFMFFGEVSFKIVFMKSFHLFVLWFLVFSIVFFVLKERMTELFSFFLTEKEHEDLNISLKTREMKEPSSFEEGDSSETKGRNLDLKVGDEDEKTGDSKELLLERRSASSFGESTSFEKKADMSDVMRKADSKLVAKAVSSMINKDK